MHKVLKRALLGLAAVAGVVTAAAGSAAVWVEVDGIPKYEPKIPARAQTKAEVTKEHVERGAKLATLLCAGCHESEATGRFTGKLLADVPSAFGTIYSKNITQHGEKGIGGWTDAELRYFLRTGIRPDGQYVPLYMIKLPHASDEDLDSIIAFLRSDDPRVAPTDVNPPGVTKPSFLTKALSHTIGKPLPYPSAPIVAPAKTDRVAYGRYLTNVLDCYSCHSADFTKVDPMNPDKSVGYMGGGNELLDVDGKPIYSANLTADDETGIGKWSEGDFVRAVKKGFRPDGRVVHYPMAPMPNLDDDEVAAIYAYLRTVPKIHNAVKRPEGGGGAVANGDHPGKQLYRNYGCNSCHGESGVGPVGDLSHANEHYATDDELRAWLDDAPNKKPGTKMPAWKGVIKEQDYAPLMAYVRALAVGSKQASR